MAFAGYLIRPILGQNLIRQAMHMGACIPSVLHANGCSKRLSFRSLVRPSSLFEFKKIEGLTRLR